jgi:ParB family chromosome partitioning protein
MATAAKIATEVATVVLNLSPHDVLVGERMGAFCPLKAEAVGRLMEVFGQNEPIKVRASGPRAAKPWTLIAGLKRLEGAKLRELRIDAIEAEGDEITLRQIEASENIERGSPSPLERACYVRAIADAAEARLAGQHEGLTQQQIAVRARWAADKQKAPGVVRDDDLNKAEADHTAANFATVYGWQESTAAALGLSKRTIRDDLALHRALVAPFPALYRALATHPTIGENASALRDIAAIKDVGNRRALIEALIETPDMTLDQAMEGLGLSKPAAPGATGATKFMNNMASNLRRLSAGDQARIAPEIVKTMKPSALLALRAALDARIEQEGIKA